jgi:O-methyltransferase
MTNSRWEIFWDGLAKKVLFWSPLRPYLLYKYRYAFTPAQLARLTALATEAAAAPGDFCEIGCYRGYTTVFLNRHLDAVAPAKRYWAVDTFGGFTAADVAHETGVRGKTGREERRALAKFTVNSRAWFEANLRHNGITRVSTHAAAVQDFAFPAGTALCFALLDVDLHLPTVAGLEKIWPLLAPGGLVVVDDCQADHAYDGARQAVLEFCARHGVAHELVETKLAVRLKPRA